MKEIQIIRELASRVNEIAQNSQMEQRRTRWKLFNDLKPERPMVLCFPEGAWEELLPQSVLQCSDSLLRNWEWSLRSKIYWWENIRDDAAIDTYFDIARVVDVSNFGVETKYTHGENKGSATWDIPISDLEADFEKLKFRTIDVNIDQTKKNYDLAGEIFGDILMPRIKNDFWWTLGLTNDVIKLIGLENFMIYMYDEPKNLHRLMAWMRDECLNYINTLENEGLLSLNNGANSVGSGGVGYTSELPQIDFDSRHKVLTKDMWGFGESQETVGVSPQMFAEFVLPYQIPILEKFGLNCYGCCEPLEKRWEYIKQIPNLRRISVSPWANQEAMAEVLGKNYIFSRKPNPSIVCNTFNKDEIRADIKNTISIAKNSPLEIILKDTHTIQNEPDRITEWVKIALEEVGA